MTPVSQPEQAPDFWGGHLPQSSGAFQRPWPSGDGSHLLLGIQAHTEALISSEIQLSGEILGTLRSSEGPEVLCMGSGSSCEVWTPVACMRHSTRSVQDSRVLERCYPVATTVL